MAFQTNVFRDGEWVTETVDLSAALKASASAAKEPDETISHRPPCGILSSTVVESPMVNKILHVHIRSRNHNDIAFIGSNVVTIRELRDNGQTHEIFKYKSYGSRIRNAIVLGDSPDDTDSSAADGQSQLAEIDSLCQDPLPSSHHNASRILPPQLLVLVLENGQIEFLFTTEASARMKLYTSSYAPPGNIPYHAHHLAVDPSFRYMAAAPFENLLVVYEMETLDDLDQRFRDTGKFPKPFKLASIRPLRGTIHDVQFLYPRLQDDYHIIIMVIMSSRNQTPEKTLRRKYITWDWEAGEDLRAILTGPGHRQSLSKLDGVPLFSIPLKSRNAFFIVYEDHMAIVRQSLSSGEYDSNRVLEMPGPSELHHGARPPLWVSWARPFRRKDYSEKTDIIYLAREDGLVVHIEIDSETLLYSGMQLGYLGTNIGTAFTTAYDKFSDLLVVGGESSSGGIWKLAARSELEQISAFSNWSPATDMAMTNSNRPKVSGFAHGLDLREQYKPERVFLASGRGATGCLTELRFGLKARIGIDLDIGEIVRQVWLFSDESSNDGAMHAILALPHSTTVLRFESGFADVRAESEETSHFDTTFRTLHAIRTASGSIVQVSEGLITLVTESRFLKRAIGDIIRVPGAIAEQAHCLDDEIVVYVQGPDEAHLYLLSINQMDVSLRNSWAVPGEVGCLSQFHLGGRKFVIIGSVTKEGPMPSIYDLNGELIVRGPVVPRQHWEAAGTLDPFSSICVVRETERGVDIIAGTRFGKLLTIKILQSTHTVSISAERMGSASVGVFQAPGLPGDGASAFVTCDNTLFRLSELADRRNVYMRKDVVWATDASDMALPSPPIHSVFAIKSSTADARSQSLVLLLSASSLYVADIEPRSGPVPRIIAPGWKGTPTRILYSNVWNCLVVGLQVEDGIELALVDPDTGRSISKPLDKDKMEGQLSSFGTSGDRILGLHEWMYVKDGQTFPFIVVTTQSGKLLVVSVATMRHPETEPPYRRLEHWTRYRKKNYDEPVYSVVADDQGLLYAAGRTVFWDILDLDEKKMKPVKQYLLESPAISLEIVDGKLRVLTTMHSVEVIDYKGNMGNLEMTHICSDRSSRAATHMISMEQSTDKGLWPVTLLSDIAGGIAGLWAPPSETNAQEMVTVFEGRIGNPVRKFARGHCRPSWQIEGQDHRRFGCLGSTLDGAEVLGISLDGTLRHFSLLTIELWRYLALVQMLAQGRGGSTAGRGWNSHDGDEEPLEPEVDVRNMHIQGDLLNHIVENRLLERLVAQGNCLALFCRFLDGLEGGTHTSRFRQGGDDGGMVNEELRSMYFDLGYDVLNYVLIPAL
ncbi:thermotolerance protein [Geosmithia morbida]|uniref:Thermotolerance protein n=1 Tax=Geosmithia morbida TaxID=1094350 RepID=A0A9P4Z075_9HYPO|nr:thermotolerance protein [Geosmithia morbida]KAF4125290.1 thermotolerance protein [Geosmithia morbida]